MYTYYPQNIQSVQCNLDANESKLLSLQVKNHDLSKRLHNPEVLRCCFPTEGGEIETMLVDRSIVQFVSAISTPRN